MYGGVATPLALLHQMHQGGGGGGDSNVHSTKKQQNRTVVGEGYSARNTSRLPPLRESSMSGGQGGGECEPLLPSSSGAALKIVPRQGKKSRTSNLDDIGNLPPPPLPPHNKTFQQSVMTSSKTAQRPAEVTRYTPPWPRGGGGGSVGTSEVSRHTNINSITNTSASGRTANHQSKDNNLSNTKPYLKPLPKPPTKEILGSRSHHNNKIGPPPQPPPYNHQLRYRAEEAAIRTKLRNNPLQRHYSDESLQGAGSFGLYFSSPHQQQHRIHSSADEISSLNHSPSISSSDESYSRTTDADASPSPSPPLHAETSAQQWLYPSDIQVDPSSSLENSPRASMDYIPPQCFVPNNSVNIGLNHNNNSVPGKSPTAPPVHEVPISHNLSSSRSFSPSSHQMNTKSVRNTSSSNGGVNQSSKRDWSLSPGRHRLDNSSSTNNSRRSNKSSVATNTDNLPPATLLALAAACNTMDSSSCCSPLPLGIDGQESYRGDSCGSFEYIGHRNQRYVVSDKHGSNSHSCGTNGRSSSKGIRQNHSLDKKVGSLNSGKSDSVSVTREDSVQSKSSVVHSKQSPIVDSLNNRESVMGYADDEDDVSHLTSASEKSSKKDGSSQTDRKDMGHKSNRHHSTSSSVCTKKSDTHSPISSLQGASGKLSSAAPISKYHHHHGNIDTAAKLPNFEREIQKLLDEQNLLKNIPPKSEKTHQNKEIISLEELKNVNQVLAELGHSSYLERDAMVLGRYVINQADLAVCNNNNPSGQPQQEQVGLAAIQELARKQQDELNNIMDSNDNSHSCLVGNKFGMQDCSSLQRAGSKEGSLKRGRNGTPPIECETMQDAVKFQRKASVSASPVPSGCKIPLVIPGNNLGSCTLSESKDSYQGVRRNPSFR